MPMPARAAPLEVQGIRADVQMRIQAPAGCGRIRSWHGQMQDMDGNTRSSIHRGLDIVAPAGTPVRAAAPGKVIYQERQWAGGNSLLIWHGKDHFGNRVISYYAHLQEFKTQVDKMVERGEVIGLLGATGNNMPKSGTPHLHFEVLIYPEDEPVFRFGWLRNFTTVSPNYFYYPLSAQSGLPARSELLPWESGQDYGDTSGVFTGFTFPLACITAQ